MSKINALFILNFKLTSTLKYKPVYENNCLPMHENKYTDPISIFLIQIFNLLNQYIGKTDWDIKTHKGGKCSSTKNKENLSINILSYPNYLLS